MRALIVYLCYGIREMMYPLCINISKRLGFVDSAALLVPSL